MFIRPRHTSGGLNRVTGSKIAVIILIALWVQCFCLFRVVCTWTVYVWSWSTASLHTWTLDLWWNQPLRRQQRRATTTVRSVYDNMTMLMTRRGRLPNFSTSGWDIVIHRFDSANFSGGEGLHPCGSQHCVAGIVRCSVQFSSVQRFLEWPKWQTSLQGPL